MVEELRRVMDLLGQQPEDVQRHIAELVSLQLEEAQWDATVGSPEGQATLERLAAEARADIAAGDVEDGGWE